MKSRAYNCFRQTTTNLKNDLGPLYILIESYEQSNFNECDFKPFFMFLVAFGECASRKGRSNIHGPPVGG